MACAATWRPAQSYITSNSKAGAIPTEIQDKAAGRLAVGTCVLTLILIAGTVVMTILNGGNPYEASFAIVGVSSTIVGGVVASRRATNPVGWLFLGGALGAVVHVLAEEYAVYGVITSPGALPLPHAMAWLSSATFAIGPVIDFILIPLYFPDGKLVSRRWDLVAWFSVGSLLLFTVLFAIAPGEALDGSGVQNPLGVEALRQFMEAFEPFFFVWYLSLILAAAASLVVRFLRSVGEERQQLKWFT